MKPASLLLLAAALAAPLAASADDIHQKRQQITRYIRQQDPSSRELQFKALRMRENQTLNLPINLRAGKAYSFLSTCEDACFGLTMELKDSYDLRVGLNDTFQARVNRFGFTPERSGKYMISINLRGCYDEEYGCEVGLNVHEGSKEIYRSFR